MPDTSHEIHNNMDIINSRDIIKRINELNEDYEDFETWIADATKEEPTAEEREELETLLDEFEDWKADYGEELYYLNQLQEEMRYNREWEDGLTMIHEDFFEEYCESRCIDVGYISRDFPSWIVIDWEATAENMKEDYSEVEFNGNIYYYSSL